MMYLIPDPEQHPVMVNSVSQAAMLACELSKGSQEVVLSTDTFGEEEICRILDDPDNEGIDSVEEQILDALNAYPAPEDFSELGAAWGYN